MPKLGQLQLGLLTGGQAVLWRWRAGGRCGAGLHSAGSPQTVEVVGLVQVGHGDDLLAVPNDAQRSREAHVEAGLGEAGH